MKATLLLALLGLVAVTAHSFSEEEYQLLFSKWMAQHNKKYTHDTFFYRYNVFKANLDFVARHSAQQHSYTVAMNAFGDMTNEEFVATHNGYKHVKRNVARSHNKPAAKKHVHAAESLDWRTKGAVTPVKDQKQCGSCWAFSTTGSVEGAHAISKGKLVSFSEQQLVDCSTAEGNQGCEGGLMDYAFQYIINNGEMLCAEANYPYDAETGTCRANKGSKCPKNNADQVDTGVTAFTDVTSGDEGALMMAVNKQPVSIAIEADQEAFQFYSGGVFDAACGTQLDHGVLVVGYGTDAGGKDFWIVKNSWGTSWGENGYIRMIRDKDECGLATEPSYPVVPK